MALLRITFAIIFASSAFASTAVQILPSSVRWSVVIPARAVGPPTIAGELIVIPLESGHVVAYSAADGKEAWRLALRVDQAVVADGSQLFIAAGEMIHAVSAADGTVLWRAPSGTVTAPLLAQDGWVGASAAGQLAAFREADGSKVWGHASGPQHTRATIEGNNLYVPLDEGRLLALDLRTGAERWTRFPARGPLSEVLALPDRVFVGASNKTFYAYDADDGAIDWPPLLGTTLRGRPESDGTRVFITGMDNMVRAFDRHSGALLWHAPVPYRPTGPVIVGSLVVVPGVTADIRAFEAASGKAAAGIKLEQQLAVPPVFAGGGADARLAAITGTITSEWRLLLAVPPAPPAPPE